MISTLRPWPSRSDRLAAIEAATAGKKAAQKRAEDAVEVRRSIDEIVYGENHFAQAIAETFRQRRPGKL